MAKAERALETEDVAAVERLETVPQVVQVGMEKDLVHHVEAQMDRHPLEFDLESIHTCCFRTRAGWVSESREDKISYEWRGDVMGIYDTKVYASLHYHRGLTSTGGELQRG